MLWNVHTVCDCTILAKDGDIGKIHDEVKQRPLYVVRDSSPF